MSINLFDLKGKRALVTGGVHGLGMAIVASPNNFLDFETYDTEAKDLSNVYAHLNVNENKAIYYAGFAWKESGQFTSQKKWEQYLINFAEKINSPLEVILK